MNREIIFRAKAVNSGEWVESITIANGTIKRKAHDLFMEISENKWVGIKNETLSQFIGTKDKNGVKIYEGHILKTNEADWIGKVEFKHSAYIISDDKGGYSTYPDFSKCEVIGNIHDNQELLQ